MSRPNVTADVINGLSFARACVIDQRDAARGREDPSWDKRYEAALAVLGYREGSSWVVQALEQDVASRGASLLGAFVDLGRMFDARDQLIAEAVEQIALLPRAPAEYAHAIAQGHYVGVLPLGAVRVAQVYIGIYPLERRTP